MFIFVLELRGNLVPFIFKIRASLGLTKPNCRDGDIPLLPMLPGEAHAVWNFKSTVI